MRNLPLDRSEAELLDSLLLAYATSNEHVSCEVGNISAQLCETWGMAYWHHRKDSGITEARWGELTKFSEFGHREKSVLR